MPSPFGHLLAGIAVAWGADLLPGDRSWRTAATILPKVPGTGTWHPRTKVPGTGAWHLWERAGGGLTLVCAGLAAAPDLDLAFIAHRTATHSLVAVVLVACVAGLIAAFSRRPVARVALMCACAYGSHLLLDWLGADFYPPRGIQLLWPINREWYISGFDLFRQTARLRIFTRGPMLTNLRAIAQEMAILIPTAVAVWLVRGRALAMVDTPRPSVSPRSRSPV
jgi:membrane-bound metal-dependent hydrolase YbcI (DUF457 family)